MSLRLRSWYEELGKSLWPVPTALTVAIVLLAWATVEIDKALLASGRADVYFAFGGGATGARGVLEAIASTTITVTGLVFSVTIVALQLASSQYTPRVLRSFTGDRGNQVVLGVFIATFTYSLLVLRTVRSTSEDGGVFVPSLSVGVAIMLALCSVGLLIYYIHHASRSIQVSVIVDRATRDTLNLIDRLFPEQFHSRCVAAGPGGGLRRPTTPVSSAESGYVQAVDAGSLRTLADNRQLAICVERRIGEFVLYGTPLASVAAVGSLEEDVIDAIRNAFVLGAERTLQEDVAFGLQQIADIGLRALSPGINDPTTAATCIDRLAQLLVHLGHRILPHPPTVQTRGATLLMSGALLFEDAVAVSFEQLGYHAAEHPVLARYLITTLGAVASSVPSERRRALHEQAEQVLGRALQQTLQPAQRRALEHTAEWLERMPT